MLESWRKIPRPWSSVRSALVGVVLIVLALQGAEVAAQEEIAPFKLTNVNGELSMRYWFDERNDTWANGGSAGDSTRWQEGLYIRTRSYVYHPALLEMFISGGSTFAQSRDYSNTVGRDRLLTYNARLNFLSLKAYPFTVFFEQSNPEVATGSTGRFNIVNNAYGIWGSLKEPLLPVIVNWTASHNESKGSGFDTTVDDSADRASLNTAMQYKSNQNVRLDLDWIKRESRSGSPGLPIRETLIENMTSRLTGRNAFGKEEQILLNQHLERRQEERVGTDTTRIDSLGYAGSMNWRHSDRVSSTGRLKLSDIERDTTWSRDQSISGGTNFRLWQRLALSGSGGLGSSESPSISRDTKSLSFIASYGWRLPFGALSMSASLAASRTDQYSSADTAEVFEESVILVGLIPAVLREEFVVTSSVIVTNVSHTQIYIEDIDYRLVTIGSTTTLERLVTGNIVDGQEVLVSYDYRTGGTVEYERRSQKVGANLSFSNRGSLFVNLIDTRNDILSGYATTPLNDMRRIDTGGKVNFPFTGGWAIGGEVRYTKQDEDISPFVRTSFDTYVQLPRYWNTRVRLGLNRARVNYELSGENRDRTNFFLNIDARLPGGMILAYSGTHGESDGSSLFREDQRHRLRLDWRYRMVVFSLNATKSHVVQGESSREDTRVFVALRRYF